MLKIKRIRFGMRNKAFFKIVAIDHRRNYARNMKILGYCDVHNKKVVFDKESIIKLIQNGAKITKKLYFYLKKYHDFGIQNVK